MGVVKLNLIVINQKYFLDECYFVLLFQNLLSLNILHFHFEPICNASNYIVQLNDLWYHLQNELEIANMDSCEIANNLVIDSFL